jgi:hypothetical protein
VTAVRAALVAAVLGAAACAGGGGVPGAATPAPAALERAHAHNDYAHARPLLDALERGFASVEADVHLVDGALLVAHHRDSVERGRTLERLYLEPLRARAQAGQLAGAAPLVLLIDLKSEAEATYAALHRVLRGYADILTVFAGDTVVDGPVLAVVSGNRPVRTMAAARVRFAALDGRLPDLADTAGAPARVAPLVSDDWKRVTTWRGDGPAPAALRDTLARLAARARAQGRRLRFWGTPDVEAVWAVLYEAGVDLIGTDDLEGLRGFLVRRGR